jgi:transcriptional regulator with XRE-family HTH domain
MKIGGRQLAAARTLLGWSQDRLAEAADLSRQALLRWENDQTAPHEATIQRVVQVIEAAGVEFTNGDQPGVRFKKRPTEAERSAD